VRVTRALGALAVALLAVALAGCLAAPPERPRGPRPVVTKDGSMTVWVERYRVRSPEDADGGPAHYEAIVRARRTKGSQKGECVWYAPLDGDFMDAMGPTGADDDVTLALDGTPGSEVVRIRCPGGRERRFLLATGERLN
jgi:hypothetical protein